MITIKTQNANMQITTLQLGQELKNEIQNKKLNLFPQ